MQTNIDIRLEKADAQFTASIDGTPFPEFSLPRSNLLLFWLQIDKCLYLQKY
jgi:hypothetical protein